MNSVFTNLDETLSADALLDQILAVPTKRACITCSFQAEDVVVLHMLHRRLPGIPVLFLDTGYHFQETYAYRDRLTAAWNLNLRNITPAMSVPAQENAFGVLHRTDPGLCCNMRKTEPLIKALKEFDFWFTGLRREQSPTRASLKKIEQHRLPDGQSLCKLSLLADWNWPQVWEYLSRHGIEPLSLYSHGYTSIGCKPCTTVPLHASDPRSGRWAGQKLECGIHTFSKRTG